MPRRLDRDRCLRLADSLNLHRSMMSACHPRTVRIEHTGLCACCTFKNQGTPTYSNRIAVEVRTLYRAGVSSVVRYLCVTCCRDLAVVYPELRGIAYNALVQYRVIERELRAEDRALDAEEMVLIRKEEAIAAVIQPEIVTVAAVGTVSPKRPTRGKQRLPKPKFKAVQQTIFQMEGL